jgi:hypothetical protein
LGCCPELVIRKDDFRYLLLKSSEKLISITSRTFLPGRRSTAAERKSDEESSDGGDAINGYSVLQGAMRPWDERQEK